MKVAADANVLLSAIIGGEARRVLANPAVEVFTTDANRAEVEEYAAILAHKRGLDVELVLLAAVTLPVKDPRDQTHTAQGCNRFANRALISA